MKTYTATIINTKTNEHFTIFEFERNRFDCRCFKIVLREMFFWACQGCDNDNLIAIISDNNTHAVCALKTETVVNGSTIDCYVSARWQRAEWETIRVMNIAS